MRQPACCVCVGKNRVYSCILCFRCYRAAVYSNDIFYVIRPGGCLRCCCASVCSSSFTFIRIRSLLLTYLLFNCALLNSIHPRRTHTHTHYPLPCNHLLIRFRFFAYVSHISTLKWHTYYTRDTCIKF